MNKTKIACVYHSIDLDGWMSAAVVKHWFNITQGRGDLIKAINKDNSYYKFTDNGPTSIDFIGYNYGQPIPDLSEYDEIIMCDISFPKEELLKLNTPNDRLIWIDHHASILKEFYENFDTIEATNKFFKGLRSSKFAACELTWKYLFPNELMPEIVRLLGRYDCFGHKQVWKPVIGYEGLYEVSNHGNVRSLDRIIIENNTNKERQIKGINLSIANSKRGYRVVVLCKNGTENMRNVHQLVAESFIPNPENKPCINHKDFNRLNNYVENLEWCTYAENNLHSIEEGKRGKTVIQLTKNGEFVQQFDSIKRAESHTGIASQNIGKVCKGEREFAGDYSWEYGVDKDIFPQFVPQDEETKVLEFQYGARQCISNHEEAYRELLNCIDIEFNNRSLGGAVGASTYKIHQQGKVIYQYLCTEAKQAYKNGFKIILPETIVEKGTVKNTFIDRKFICINKERFNPINFGIDYHSEGYDGAMCWHLGADKMINISFYNDNGQVDCSAIAKIFRGGGHKGAAGCRMDLLQFQELIF